MSSGIGFTKQDLIDEIEVMLDELEARDITYSDTGFFVPFGKLPNMDFNQVAGYHYDLQNFFNRHIHSGGKLHQLKRRLATLKKSQI